MNLFFRLPTLMLGSFLAIKLGECYIQGILLIRGLEIRGFGKFTVFKTPKSPQIHNFLFEKPGLKQVFYSKNYSLSFNIAKAVPNKHFKKNSILIHLCYSHSSKFAVLKFAVFHYPSGSSLGAVRVRASVGNKVQKN